MYATKGELSQHSSFKKPTFLIPSTRILLVLLREVSCHIQPIVVLYLRSYFYFVKRDLTQVVLMGMVIHAR